MKPDAATEAVNKMTDEEVAKKFKDMMNSANNKDTKFYDELKKANDANNNTAKGDLPPESGEANVKIDTATGTYQQVADEVGIDEKMAEMLDFKPEDLVNIPDSIYDLDVPDELIEKAITEAYASDNSIDTELVKELVDLVKKYRKTPNEFKDSTNWYEQLPDRMKQEVDRACIEVNNLSKAAKKSFAQALLDELVNNSGMDSIIIDMQKNMEKAFDTSGITEYILSESRTEFEKNMEANIEKIKNMENLDEETKKEKIRLQERVLEAFKHAYTYDTFIEAIKKGKVRVKDFDVKKYKRWLSEFYYKYEQDTPFIIKDPSAMAPVLCRFFKEEFTAEQCVRFVIAYIKFTRNMSANDVVDHTYMSYFIHNVMQLDLVAHVVEERDFINILSNSIKEAIMAINNIKKEDNKDEQ